MKKENLELIKKRGGQKMKKELKKFEILNGKEAFFLRHALVEFKSKAEEQFSKEDFEIYQKMIDRSIAVYNDVMAQLYNERKED
jgi:hypothetical protein